MRPEVRDTACLWDMLQHARLALELTQGISIRAYQDDRFRQLALEGALEIVGEAARRVSIGFQSSHPEIPWKRIIAHRNVLAHEYDEILQELLWRTATDNVPALIAALEPLVPEEPAGEV
jgi:uncharacterized protein with HEPN domain